MVEVFDPIFLFYFLVLPMVVGIGIDSKIKNRYPYGAACGVVFFFICALWIRMGVSAEWGILEPIFVLIVAGGCLLFIGLVFEHKRPVSGFSRHSMVFLAVAFSGLPLYAIHRIIQGEMGFEYPASVLPLFQFTLAVVGLVVLSNVLEARFYSKNEGADRKVHHMDKDIVDIRFEDMDDLIAKREFDYSQEGRFPSSHPDAGFMKMDQPSDDLLKK
jgi:hypothetical protein